MSQVHEPKALDAPVVQRARYDLAEFLVLFVTVPCLLGLLRDQGQAIPVIPALLGFVLLTAALLLRDERFSFRASLRWHWDGREAWRIVGVFAVAAPLLALWVWSGRPDAFLSFPREKPAVWVAVMLLYPCLSVVPQELIFRVFFFHRYANLFRSVPATVAASAFSFGLAHLLFGWILSVVLSAAGGVLFAWTYYRTRSVWMAVFEHALYGCLVFTIGMGRYFYAAGTL